MPSVFFLISFPMIDKRRENVSFFVDVKVLVDETTHKQLSATKKKYVTSANGITNIVNTFGHQRSDSNKVNTAGPLKAEKPKSSLK